MARNTSILTSKTGVNTENASALLAKQLWRARLTLSASCFLAGLFRWLWVNLTLWGILTAGDILLAFPAELRLPMAVSGTGVTLFTFFKWLIKPLFAFHNLDRTALELEKRLGIRRNLLINSFQLSRCRLSSEEQALARETIRLGLSHSGKIKYYDLLQLPLLLKGAGIAMSLIVLWLIATAVKPDHIHYALSRFYSPFADTPPPGKVILTVIPDTDVTVQEGDDYSVMLRIEPRNKRPDIDLGNIPPRIVIADGLHPDATHSADGRGTSMIPVDTRSSGPEPHNEAALFSHQFSDLRRSLSFRIFHDPGGAYTRSYQVRVQKNPDIIESKFRVTPPKYTGLTRADTPGPPRNVAGLPESGLLVAVRLDTKVENLFWEANDEIIEFTGDDGYYWTCETNIRKAGAYTVFTLPDSRLQRRLQIAAGNMLVKPDLAPRVTFATDRLNREAWPGETINIDIIAEDDYGVSDVTLSVKPGHAGDNEEVVVATREFEGPPGELRPDTIHVPLTLNPSDFTPGNDYLFRARARDFSPNRQTGTSRTMLVRIREMTELPDSTRIFSALEALQQAIIVQRRALSDTRTVVDYMDDVLGLAPERQDFTFHHHRQQIETRQHQVYELLETVLKRSAGQALPYIDDVEKTRIQMVKPLVENIKALSGDNEPWFAGPDLPLENNWPVLRFNPAKTRFVGIAAISGNGPVSISGIDLMDKEGLVIPPPYIDKYHLSPIHQKWNGPVGFVELDETELQRIIGAALETGLQGGTSPLLDLSSLSENTPRRDVALYVVRQIHCDNAKRAVLTAGSSDSLRVWVNGKLVINRLAVREPAQDQDRALLELNQGRNLILAEVSAANRTPVLAMRLSTPDGTRLALRDDGRMEKALSPKIAYAGGNPSRAYHTIDRDPGTTWRIENNRRCLLIIDLGACIELSGLKLHIHGKGRNNTSKNYKVYTAENLRIYDKLPPIVHDIAERQTEILDRLSAIRAAWLEHDGKPVEQEEKEEARTAPATPAVAGLRELVAELLDTSGDSIELSRQRRSVLEQYGSDFTEDITARLQEIKRSEQRIAMYLRDIVQDMSALGDLDLPSATQSANLQELVEKSALLADIAKEKSDKPITHISDSLDTAEIELHEELKQQSEAAFGDTSGIQDEQELGEDMKTPLPMAELPQTLGDLVGEMEKDLLEFEEEAQTIGSMLKALDADGPIGPGRMSSTSAEGKTGDEPPDAAREIEGRSGFGRTGRASGEGVTDVAEDLPQDNGAAPPRDTGTSLEEGMVEDRSTTAAAESTGLGKETDDTIMFGMGGGRLPPGVLERMRQTAGAQQDTRETISRMILELRRHNIPSAKLSRAARAMELISVSAEEGDLQQFTHAYVEAIDHLYHAEKDIGHDIGMLYIAERREHIENRPQAAASVYVPEPYRNIVSEYFKALATDEPEK